MPIQNHLLQRAYALAEKKKFKDVSILLNAVIRENPNNIEAWEFNLNIFSRDRNKLEELGGRINNSELIDPQIKEEVLVYYKYLLNRSVENATPESLQDWDWYLHNICFYDTLVGPT
jgi:hypothetical protein